MVSVVMPAYNAARYIDPAIESIRAQTLADFELIVIDDLSTDDTAARAEKHAAADPRIRVIRAEKGGISRSLNKGIALAKHPWIAIMHSDDIAMPERLAKQLAAANRQPEVVAWGCFAQHIGSGDRVLSLSQTGPTSVEEFRRLRAAGEDVHMIHPTAFLRKDVLEKVGGYNPAFDGAEDFELFDRMAVEGPIVVLPEPLMHYRVHASSVSMTSFFKILKYVKFVQSRQQARLKGETIDYNQFSAEYDGLGFFSRVLRATDQLSRLYYRTAGMAFGGRAYVKACAYLMASGILRPQYCIPRVWNQFLSPTARRAIHKPQLA
ncbi:glycosyltransferase family 2 protein [Humisphaera borealis]|uniref:Glycosyltransferase family 2 protein n=1 Tax=Humisphaera borealis TaxID=2807512 RepID=A0A7M2X4S8_9BACT|nr:glycosyltransferase family 2 protein [Humisphaera borealis]QOV91780.1 glycosyltransferase family 2 protein [Humisphaera borealis]